MPRATFSSVSSPTYASISRARSSSQCLLRRNRLQLMAHLLLSRPQHLVHCASEPVPLACLFDELFAPGRSQPIISRPPIVLRGAPKRCYPAPVFKPVQRGIERAVLDLENILGAVFDNVGNRVTVCR